MSLGYKYKKSKTILDMFTTSDNEQIADFISRALREDVGSGDHTSLACVPADATGRAHLLIKERGVLAGIEMAQHIFKAVDPTLEVEVVLKDGAAVKSGDIAFRVAGSSRSILKAERLVLNTMQRMSGIATMTQQYVSQIQYYPVTLLDTRKTTPTLRFLEKWAVRIGGATNYRTGLYDRIMIKDNHIDFCGSVKEAIAKVHTYLKEEQLDLDITVEVRNFEELEQVLQVGGVQRIMLDNFAPEAIKEALVRIEGRFETEASGGITLESLRRYAETGINYISVGALTHSFTSLDMSLKEY